MIDRITDRSRTRPTTDSPAEQVREESLWFGAPERPLFGRMTHPPTQLSRGGVLLSPPIGREGRLARRALRQLAIALARSGFVVLRFDHYGTGDFSGTLDGEFDSEWLNGIDHGVTFLHSLGVTSISGIGMRMGATILGAAATNFDIEFSSAVLWDPCESGRSFLRELDILSVLGRDGTALDSSKLGKRSEYVYDSDAALRIGEITLMDPRPRPLAPRVLVIARNDRTVSSRLRLAWESEGVEWSTTSEQGSMLETELPKSLLPTSTIIEISSWIGEAPSAREPYHELQLRREVTVATAPQGHSVQESIVEIGSRRLFGVVCEPANGSQGPLIVMVNGTNEDHVGPSKLWVELSRRWASYGLRTVRFDFRGIGESPPMSDAREGTSNAATRPYDLAGIIRALIPTDPSASVLIGLCSGSQQALSVGLELHSRGVCAINPQGGPGILRTAERLASTEQGIVRLARRFGRLLNQYPWIDKLLWQTSRLMLPSAYSPKLRAALVDNDTELLVLVSPEDIGPFPRIPILRSIDRRRLTSSEHCRVEIVSGMDHDFLIDLGRARAIAVLDEHVLEKFAWVAPGQPTSDGP